MRSALMLLGVCGAVACEPGTCDAEEGVLLQAKSLIRRHKQTDSKDAKGVLQSLQNVATSLTKGSDASMSPDEVNAAIGSATSALETMFPALANEHRLAQQSIDDAVRAIEACHDAHGSETTARLEQAVATHYSELEECDESLGQAMQAEVEACEGQDDDPNCLCTEARTAVVDQRALCASVTTTYEVAFCEFHLLCSTFEGCHDREVAIYDDVRADVQAEMLIRQQQYVTAMQAQCLLQLIMGAMTSGTPIPDDPLTACDDVSVEDLVLSFPDAPAAPECPDVPSDAPQCDEIVVDPPLQCNWALPGSWAITATSHWDGNYAPSNVKVHGGNPWHTGRANTLPQDLNFDAGEEVTLSGIATAHPTGWAGSAMQAYTFSVSNDGSSWTEVVSGTGINLGNQQRQEIDFPQTSGRYWRLHVTTNHGYGNYVTDQFVELKVCAPCEPFGWVLPSDWSVTASSQWDGNYAASNVKVHGGNPWHTGRSNTLPDNLNFDAGHEVTLSGFATAHPGGWAGSAMNNYAFSKSDDGVHYTEVHSGAGRNLAHGERQEIEFEPATARYWRLYVTSNHGYGNYVTDQYVEFKVQNDCGSVGSDTYEDFRYTGGDDEPEVALYRYGDVGGRGFDGGNGDGNSCPTSDVSEAECLAAVQSLLPVGVSQGRTHLVAGSWGWVPPGCSVQSHFTHGRNGDWAAHYNRGNGNNDGGYTKVCTLPGRPQYHMLGYGMPNCPEGKTIDTREECEAAHTALGLEINPVWAGSYSPIPGLCSTRVPDWGGRHHLHFNSVQVGTIRDDLTPVCKV